MTEINQEIYAVVDNMSVADLLLCMSGVFQSSNSGLDPDKKWAARVLDTNFSAMGPTVTSAMKKAYYDYLVNQSQLQLL